MCVPADWVGVQLGKESDTEGRIDFHVGWQLEFIGSISYFLYNREGPHL